MTRVLRAVARALSLVLFILCAALAPFALLPIAARWPSRREDAIVAQALRAVNDLRGQHPVREMHRSDVEMRYAPQSNRQH